MKLDYKILWVDDRIEERPFQRILDSTKNHLISQNFECEIISAKEYNEFVNNYHLKNEYDIIITDYTLNNGTFGNQVIDYVRDNQHNYTEVFFYSAQTRINDIKLYSNSRITFFQLTEGDYRELEAEVKEVINQTIKKFQHIVAMRGMIMNETSTLDMQMLDILKLALKSKDISFDDLAPKIYDELNELYKSKNKFVNECREAGKFLSLTKDNFVFSADYKIRTLGQILGSLNIKDFSEEYKEEINSMRNKFAHAVLLKDEQTGREYFKHGESGLTFDEELCKKIRMDIIKHRNNLNEISEALNQS